MGDEIQPNNPNPPGPTDRARRTRRVSFAQAFQDAELPSAAEHFHEMTTAAGLTAPPRSILRLPSVVPELQPAASAAPSTAPGDAPPAAPSVVARRDSGPSRVCLSEAIHALNLPTGPPRGFIHQLAAVRLTGTYEDMLQMPPLNWGVVDKPSSAHPSWNDRHIQMAGRGMNPDGYVECDWMTRNTEVRGAILLGFANCVDYDRARGNLNGWQAGFRRRDVTSVPDNPYETAPGGRISHYQFPAVEMPNPQVYYNRSWDTRSDWPVLRECPVFTRAEPGIPITVGADVNLAMSYMEAGWRHQTDRDPGYYWALPGGNLVPVCSVLRWEWQRRVLLDPQLLQPRKTSRHFGNNRDDQIAALHGQYLHEIFVRYSRFEPEYTSPGINMRSPRIHGRFAVWYTRGWWDDRMMERIKEADDG